MCINYEALAKAIAPKIADMVITQKEVLTSAEAARYMGISKSYLYKLTMDKVIPYYKPMGKVYYFNRIELEEWLQRNKQSLNTEE